jgi:hypothetical protein
LFLGEVLEVLVLVDHVLDFGEHSRSVHVC